MNETWFARLACLTHKHWPCACHVAPAYLMLIRARKTEPGGMWYCRLALEELSALDRAAFRLVLEEAIGGLEKQ